MQLLASVYLSALLASGRILISRRVNHASQDAVSVLGQTLLHAQYHQRDIGLMLLPPQANPVMLDVQLVQTLQHAQHAQESYKKMRPKVDFATVPKATKR